MFNYCQLIVLFVLLQGIHPLYASDSESYLFGDWSGERQSLEQRGFTLEAVLTLEAINNTQGGIKEDSAFLSNLDLTVEVDTKTVGWWDNGTFFLYLLGNDGDDPSSLVGDTQVSSNIETNDAFKIYEAWYEHTLSDELSLLAGLHDYNSEFYALEYAGTFLNSSFGIGPDTSQIGPSIFSTTSLTTRLKYQSESGRYLLAAVYDGIPGDPNKPQGTHIILNGSDGIFTSVEAGVSGGEENQEVKYFKYGLGVWFRTTDFQDDIDGSDHSNNSGVYFIGEVTPAEKLGLFLQAGIARSDRNQLAQYIGAGLNYTGLFNSRGDDVVGLAVSHARNGDDFMDSNPGIDRAETAIELTYFAEITPWLTLQPDLQYILDPGMDPTLDDALVAGLRMKVSL